MFDYSKISFNECDKDEIPVQFFFSYDMSIDDLDTFRAYYIDEEDIPDDKEIIKIELCLTMFSENDFKLEAVCNLDDGSQEWVELWDKVHNIDGFSEVLNSAGVDVNSIFREVHMKNS